MITLKKQSTKLHEIDACKILIYGEVNEENVSNYLLRFSLGVGIFFIYMYVLVHVLLQK